MTPEKLAEVCRLADQNFTVRMHKGIPMTPLINRYYAQYGASSPIDAGELREAAAFMKGLSTPQGDAPATAAQRRFARISTQLIRAARLVEMAVQD